MSNISIAELLSATPLRSVSSPCDSVAFNASLFCSVALVNDLPNKATVGSVTPLTDTVECAEVEPFTQGFFIGFIQEIYGEFAPCTRLNLLGTGKGNSFALHGRCTERSLKDSDGHIRVDGDLSRDVT